jgi:acetylornithine deacetylase/succinyl-diaminopimelate desuccinylase-like protein
VDDLALAGYLERSKDRILTTLCDWLRIPSISADPAHSGDVANSAEFCAWQLREAGLHEVEIIRADTAGADGAGLAPAVYGEWLGAGDGAPTVLVYGHHDVQPVDPLDEWTSPPFEPVVVNGLLLARGSCDDKGQVLMQTEAVRGLLGEMGA